MRCFYFYVGVSVAVRKMHLQQLPGSAVTVTVVVLLLVLRKFPETGPTAFVTNYCTQVQTQIITVRSLVETDHGLE